MRERGPGPEEVPAVAVPLGPRPATSATTLPSRPLTEKEVRRLGPVRTFFLDHPRAADVAVLLAVVIVQSAEMIGVALPLSVAVVQVLGGAVAIAALWFRRRWPLGVLAVVTGVVVVSLLVPASHGLPAGDAAYPFALYALAAARGPFWGWTGFGTSVVAVAAGSMVGAERLTPVTFEILFGGTTVLDADDRVGPFSWAAVSLVASVVVIGLIFLAVGLSVSARRERVAILVARSQDLIAAGGQQARLATMQERSRIAREMHDVVSHSLSVMITLADGAKAAAPRSPEAAAQALDMLSETGRTALAEMRRMLGVLRTDDADAPTAIGTGVPMAFALAAVDPADPTDQPTPYRPQPTADGDLSVLVERFRHAGLQVRWRLEDLPDHQGLRLAVFRVLQESLTNVLRHAPDARAEALVRVTLDADRRPERVLVQVSDDGGSRRPTAQVGSGRGLGGMRERVAMFGGELDAGPHGAGWRVRAELDVPADAGPRPSDIWMMPR